MVIKASSLVPLPQTSAGTSRCNIDHSSPAASQPRSCYPRNVCAPNKQETEAFVIDPSLGSFIRHRQPFRSRLPPQPTARQLTVEAAPTPPLLTYSSNIQSSIPLWIVDPAE
ncbi:hypothetical protein J6590_034237 [Homalodisca vitripennis]|nr:hypothetical protein J6590_034237 [Homalodisca vitripennis]